MPIPSPPPRCSDRCLSGPRQTEVALVAKLLAAERDEEAKPIIERLVAAYLDHRSEPSETFLQTYRRLGMGPFKHALYETERRVAAE